MEPKQSVSDQSHGFHLYLQGSLSLHEWPSARPELKTIYEGYRTLHPGSSPSFSSILYWLVRNRRVQCSRDGRLKWLGLPGNSSRKPHTVLTGSLWAGAGILGAGVRGFPAVDKADTLAGQKLGGNSNIQPRAGTSKGQKAKSLTEGRPGSTGKGSYRCLPCNRTCCSQQQLQEHLNGKPHSAVLRKAEKELRVQPKQQQLHQQPQPQLPVRLSPSAVTQNRQIWQPRGGHLTQRQQSTSAGSLPLSSACSTCSLQFLSSAELELHARSPHHLARLNSQIIRSNRLHLEADKGGITVSRPLQWVVVPSGANITENATIMNHGPFPQLFCGCFFAGTCPNFAVSGGAPVLLPVNAFLTLQLLCTAPKSCGVLRAVLIFKFQHFQIARYIEVGVEDAAVRELAVVEPFRSKKAPLQQGAEIVVGIAPDPPKGGPGFEIRNSCEYRVPEEVRRMLKDGSSFPELSGALTAENYCKRFATLEYIEDVQMEVSSMLKFVKLGLLMRSLIESSTNVLPFL
jgi:hypothetical protein